MRTDTSGSAGMLREPLGPLTVMPFSATVSSTPLGSGIGFLATRDIRNSLRHLTDHFTADTPGACLGIGQQTG